MKLYMLGLNTRRVPLNNAAMMGHKGMLMEPRAAANNKPSAVLLWRKLSAVSRQLTLGVFV